MAHGAAQRADKFALPHDPPQGWSRKGARMGRLAMNTVRAALTMLASIMTLVVQAGLPSTAEGLHEESEPKQFQAEPVRTAKERLGGKASDEQRVDNCKVPLDLRGSKPRPDECRDAVSTRPKR